jgi:hypothetical protein
MVEMRNRNTKRPHLVACKNLHPHDLNVFSKRHYCRRMPHFVKKQGSKPCPLLGAVSADAAWR